MPTRHPLTVSLTPELASLVAREVSSGHYATASEVVRAGLRLLANAPHPATPLPHDAALQTGGGTHHG